MKVLFSLLFLPINIIIMGSKVVLILVLRSRDKTNQWIAIEGSNVTLIADAKLAFEAILLPKLIWWSNLVEVINKACGLDIHKLFFIATILSRCGEKQQQHFYRTPDEILAFKNWVISEKCDVVACESTSDFWVPIYDALIKHLPVIVGNARDMKAFTHKKQISSILNSSHNLHWIIWFNHQEFSQKTIEHFVHVFGFAITLYKKEQI